MPATRRSLSRATRMSLDPNMKLNISNDVKTPTAKRPRGSVSTSKQSTPAVKRTKRNAMLSSDSETENEVRVEKSRVKKSRKSEIVMRIPSPKLEPSKTKQSRRSLQPSLKIEPFKKTQSRRSSARVKDEPDVEEASDSKENDSVPFVGLSEYELQIQKNIEERTKFLESLNILSARENLLELTPKTPKPVKKEYRGYAREPKTPVEPEQIRRSLRQQKMTPDGANLVLPSDREVALAEASSQEESRSRPPPGPAPLMDYYERSNTEDCQDFLREISPICGSKLETKPSVWSGSQSSVLQVMKSLTIEDNHVAKVTPQRTFSIQVHPSEEKTLVLIGGKWGELGVWDVEREDKSAGAYHFNVHSRPINCLTLQNSQPESVYTTSYDGSVRKTNLDSGIVQEVYKYTEQEVYKKYISWHTHQDENCLLVGSSEGLAVHVDVRAPQENATDYVVHHKSVKSLTVHPVNNSYFATSSLTSVRLWDLRNLKKLKPLSEVMHGKVINAIEFSPLTGKSLVSTSKDDYLRIISCDLSNLEVTKKIQHNNNTGRWLTGFKARFIPNREDLIIVGSMKYPRRMEIFDTEDGKLRLELMGESLNSVTSVTAVHPTRPIIAGSNSSGKAYAFTLPL